jgi:L-rhamnose mutarotase
MSLLIISVCQFFAHFAIEDETLWQSIARAPERQKWLRHMAHIMPSNPDHSQKAVTLREVFRLV